MQKRSAEDVNIEDVNIETSGECMMRIKNNISAMKDTETPTEEGTRETGTQTDCMQSRDVSLQADLSVHDIILADRGFTISDDIALFGAKLKIPAFTRGKQQLSQREVETSQQLARVRIHVERIIGLMKNKYTILKGPLPVQLLKHSNDADVSNIDKILTVCCALTNLSPSVV